MEVGGVVQYQALQSFARHIMPSIINFIMVQVVAEVIWRGDQHQASSLLMHCQKCDSSI